MAVEIGCQSRHGGYEEGGGLVAEKERNERLRIDGLDLQPPNRDINLDGDLGVEDAHAAMHLRASSLSRIDLFSGLSTEELTQIGQQLHFVRKRKSEIVCTEGEPSDSMYIIETGQVRVVSDVETEKIVLAYLGPGSHFGEMGLLTGEARSAGIVVSIDAELLVLTKELFDKLLADYPTIALTVSRVLAQRLRKADTQVFANKKYQIVGLRGTDGLELAKTIVQQVGSPVVILDILADNSIAPNLKLNLENPRQMVSMIADEVGLFPVALHVSDGQFNEAVSRLLDQGGFEYALVRLPSAGREATEAATQAMDAILLVGGTSAAWVSEVAVGKLWRISNASRPNLARMARRITRRSVGLALSSGAGHGLAHIGVIKVLEAAGIPIDLVAGTSMGSLIGALMVAGVPKSDPNRVGLNGEELTTWAGEMARRGNPRTGWRYWDITLPRQGILRGHSTTNWVRELTHDARFEDLDIPLYIVAAEVYQGREVILSSGSISDAVRASTSIPGLFVPHFLNGEYLTDGGAVNPVPCSPLDEAGADIIIASNTIPPIEERAYRSVRKKKGTKQAPSIFETVFSMREVSESLVALLKTKPYSVLISPKVGMYNSFEVDKYREFIKAGEEATEAEISRIKTLVGM